MVCLFHNIALVMCYVSHYRVIAAEGAQIVGFPFCEVSTCKIIKSHIQKIESHHFSGKIFPVYKVEPRAEVHLVHICLLKCTDCEGFVFGLLLQGEKIIREHSVHVSVYDLLMRVKNYYSITHYI